MENLNEMQDFTEFPAITPVPAPATPDNPPWNIPLAVGLWIASVLLIFLLPNFFVVPYAISRHVQFTNSANVLEFLQSDPYAVLLNIVAIIPAHLITVTLAWVIVTRWGKYSFKETLGWKSGGMAWWHYVAILVPFFALVALTGYFFPETENDLTRILRSSRAAVYLVAFLATFTAPIVEEVVYRGVVYSALQRTTGVVFAVVAVTVLFAMVHIPQYYPSYSTILLLTLLSLVLTLVRARTGNLLPCVILHFIFNGLQSLSLVLSPTTPETHPDPQAVTSLIWYIF